MQLEETKAALEYRYASCTMWSADSSWYHWSYWILKSPVYGTVCVYYTVSTEAIVSCKAPIWAIIEAIECRRAQCIAQLTRVCVYYTISTEAVCAPVVMVLVKLAVNEPPWLVYVIIRRCEFTEPKNTMNDRKQIGIIQNHLLKPFRQPLASGTSISI